MVPVAHPAERQIVALEVAGSNPVGHPLHIHDALGADNFSIQGIVYVACKTQRLPVQRLLDGGSLHRTVCFFPGFHTTANVGDAMETHLLQSLCCQCGPSATGTVQDQPLT